MISTLFFEDLSRKIKEIYQSSPASDMDKNMNALLQGAFSKLNLVSREEYDVQADLLRVSREKLDALEKKVSHLETLLHKHNNTHE